MISELESGGWTGINPGSDRKKVVRFGRTSVSGESVDGIGVVVADFPQQLGDMINLNWHLIGNVNNDSKSPIIHFRRGLNFFHEALGAFVVEGGTDIDDGQVLFADHGLLLIA